MFPERRSCCVLLRLVLFVDVRKLCQGVAVPAVEAMGVQPCAARSNADDTQAPLPCPSFRVLTEQEADLAIAIAVLHHQSADKRVWC